MAIDKVKTTLLLSPAAKFRLASLKARLRREGIVETESSLLERLLAPSRIASLEDELQRATRRRTAK